MRIDLDSLATQALSRAGMVPLAMERITTLGLGTSRRAAWRVELTDGRTVKVRCVRDARWALRGSWIRAGLRDDAFPPVLSRWQSVIVEAWVAGEPWLRDDAALDAQIAATAPILGRLHAVEAIAGRRVRSLRPPSRWRRTTEAQLAHLAAVGALDEACVAELRAALHRTDPGTASVGVVHGDFCLENVVLGADGRVFVVDNEEVRIDALDFDLGFVWYRWRLAEREFQRFLDAYAQLAGRRPGDLAFWKIAGVVKSAHARVTRYPATAGAALERLRTLAVEVETGA